MATIRQYVTQLNDRQAVIARKLGVDINRATKADRVLNLSLLILLSVVVKVLVDKGIITDAELLSTLNDARDDTYDDQPV